LHDTALYYGSLFFKTYVNSEKSSKILDLGSQDVNGSLRTVASKTAEYIGVDVVDGKGVDVKVTDPYKLPFEDNFFDAAVSSSCFEHTEFFWLSFLELLRVLKPEGLLYINAPSNGSFHRYPVDCWRFYPDAGIALVNWAHRNGLKETALLESFMGDQKNDKWNDFVAVFIKSKKHISAYKKRMTSSFSFEYSNAHLIESEEVLNFKDQSFDQLLINKQKEEIHNLSNSLTQITQETKKLYREIKKLTSLNYYKYTKLLRELKRIAINPIERLKFYFYRFRHYKFFFKKKATKIDQTVRLLNNLDNIKKKIYFNFCPKPQISIIIPVYNQINFTLNCLESICSSINYINYEIIIINDSSTDNTIEYLKEIKNLKIITNSENLGFVKSCNLGADEAKGEFLYFLNNDTIINDYSIDELFHTFSNLKNVGLVGSKLIYRNNKLQEAGGIIFNDASGWNYGKGKDKDHINFNYARDVDYCSGASIMIPKKLFFELGMFDNYFAPAYYEDTDLCFKVREKGLRVIYQPLSEVIHFEGATSGTNINSGVKQYQKINKEKFFTRYQDLLSNHYANGEHVIKAIDRTKIKNCLVIDTITPQPDRDSGSIDTYNQLMFLNNYGFHTTFIPLEDFAEIKNYTQDLQKKGIKCIYQPYYYSLEKFCSDHKNFFDLILINREENFTSIYPLAKKYFPNAKLWLHNVDLNFIRIARQAKIEKNFNLIKKSKKVKNSEITSNMKSNISTVVSSFELNYLQNKNINCELLPLFRKKNQKKSKTFDERNGLVFIAGFNHLPNQDALTYFLDDIFPSVQQYLPGVRCSVIGNNLPKNLLIRIKESQNIYYYADRSNTELEELTNNHKIGIAPLRYGAGMKGKIITYIANHLPFVASNIALEGINLHTIKDCIYHSNKDFVDKIVHLYQNKLSYENVQKEISFLYDQNFNEACYKASFSNILHKLNQPHVESNFSKKKHKY
jgi:GT2 family glycosyltransferase/SAM-dependent methyltransferase